MGNISAEQHNMTRRAVKQKRKKAAKNQKPIDAESPLRLAIRDREMRMRREQAKRENEQMLLKKLDAVGALRFSYDVYDFDADEPGKYFRRNVRDIQDAIKALPHDRRRCYRWEFLSDDKIDVDGMRVFVVVKKR
jgi:hypothetical protein